MKNISKNIDQAVTLLKQGKLVAIPTETVYGLAADASNSDAVLQIFQLKGRPTNHPLIVHLASAEHIPNWAIDVPDIAYQLTKMFWPGPLTLILKKSPTVNSIITGGQDTIALRCPAHPITHQILEQFGGGLAAPSANKFGRISPTTAEHVYQEFGDELELIIDGGMCDVGVESTILDLTHETPRILRPGQITLEAIQSVLNREIKSGASALSPRVSGMLKSHYAPRTKTILMSRDELLNFIKTAKKTFVILTPKIIPNCDCIQMPTNATDYAHELYHQLRIADDLNKALIIVETPPDSHKWMAIWDRLKKASFEE